MMGSWVQEVRKIMRQTGVRLEVAWYDPMQPHAVGAYYPKENVVVIYKVNEALEKHPFSVLLRTLFHELEHSRRGLRSNYFSAVEDIHALRRINPHLWFEAYTQIPCEVKAEEAAWRKIVHYYPDAAATSLAEHRKWGDEAFVAYYRHLKRVGAV